MEYKFTADNFNEEVMNSKVPVLVDFYADWCGPCQMMGPVVEELAEQYDGKVKIGKVNVDGERRLALKYQVLSIPTFLIIKDGQVVDRSMGAMPKDVLEEKLMAVI